jgi:hypothetical protein
MMATALGILSLAPIVLIFAMPLICLVACRGCEQRREEARTEMQLRVGREMNARQRLQVEVNAWLLLIKKKSSQGGY